MRLKNRTKKVVSLLLTMSILGTGTGVSTMAQSVKDKEETKQETGAEKEEQISYSEIAQQIADGIYKGKKLEESEYYDTYEAADGSVIAAYYNSPVRYEDENGKLQDYDAKLIDTDSKKAVSYAGDVMSGSYSTDTYAYVNKAGDSRQFFPEELDSDTPILMENGEFSLAFYPEISEKETVESETESEGTEDKNAEEENADNENKVELKDGNAEYTCDNTTYQYVSLNNGVKENVIFSEMPEENVQTFTYTLDGMYMKKEENTNLISLYDSKTDKQVAVLQSPFLNDATGTNYNYDIPVDISNNDNVWTVVYTLPQTYLESENTKYPVTLDPTVEWVTYNETPDPLEISFVIELEEPGKYLQYGNALNRFTVGRSGAGDYYKSYIKFKKLGKMLLGKSINYAYMNVYNAQRSDYTMNLDMHEITESWKVTTLKWSTEPAVDSQLLSRTTVGTQIGDMTQIDFTKYCDMVSRGEADASMGVELRTEQTARYMEFEGVRSQNHSPVFVVSYDSPEDISATYDGSFEISGEYDEESGKLHVTWDSYSDDITEYKVCKRTGDGFNIIGYTTENEYDISVDDIETTADIRVIATNRNGTELDTTDDVNILSNILTFEKIEGEKVNEDETLSTIITYEITIVDTDGDGLEDGYEIWDFKTLWNTETENSAEEGPVYVQDSDGDGFPDSYEVFTLGTDPAVANEEDADSDGDGLTDLEEYQKGTDPWLKDSDFDNTIDRSDSTPRKTNGHTRQTVAAAAQVHIGKYDRQYSETDEGVTYSYIANLYDGTVKQVSIDYGDGSLNKTMKYFYDAKGNNTAIIEQYDETYDPKHTQTICITYTYDDNNNVTFICDQWTKYTMAYDGEHMTSLKVGNQELMKYEDTELINNAGEEEHTSNLGVGDVINSSQNVSTYGNGQKVKTVTTAYKVGDDDTTSTASVVEIYYNDDENASYKTEYNSDGNILKFTDYTQNQENPVTYNYAYTDNTTSVTRSDGFTKSVKTEGSSDNSDEEAEESSATSTTTTTTTYGFKDVKGEDKTYTTSTATSIGEDDNTFTMTKLYNNDTYECSTDGENDITKMNLYSSLYEKYILKNTQTVKSNTNTTYSIDIYKEDKDIDYTYDLTGNITEIKINDEVKYEYSYDAHGRLTKEKDYVDNKYYEYDYNETGNMQGKTTWLLDENGKKISSTKDTVKSEYDNDQWPDQLTKYGNENIAYDASGNPINYIGGRTFTWSRGRQLSQIRIAGEQEEDDSTITYRYNENGLRTYKETENTTTTYEWDDSILLRETVTYKATNKTYDIWYLYDSTGSVVGYEYSYINEQNGKTATRIYYEKDLQGNVIGLLDSRGAEIATYAYDAWGNINTDLSTCYEGYETAYNLNHITYRGYYRDNETGFYYLKSRYYDPEICRFINADSHYYLGTSETVWGYNLYAYCESNPTNHVDNNGNKFEQLWKNIKKYVGGYVKFRVRNSVQLVNQTARFLGVDTAALGAPALKMKKDRYGIYHASFNCWQDRCGYTDIYDFLFNICTSMRSKNFPFSYAGKNYILWAWKADYINLGAGAELGIYSGGPSFWVVDKSLSMNMSMVLKYKGKQIITYWKHTWWITGFNPKYQYINASDLKVTYRIGFRSYGMYNAFFNSKPKGWAFNAHNYSATYTF